MSGFPVTVPFIIELIYGLRLLLNQRQNNHRVFTTIPALTIAAVIIAIDLTGFAMGEVARLWIHLTTGMIVSTVIWLKHTQYIRAFKWLTLLLAFLGLWMTLFLRVADTGYPSYAPRFVPTTVKADNVIARFDEGFTLTGLAADPQISSPGGVVEVELIWHTEKRSDIPYTVFVHLLDEQGELVTQADSMPLDNSLPTTCWVPGETIRDVHLINVPQQVRDGSHQIIVGWYDLETMTRLKISSSPIMSDAYLLPDTITIVSE